jgi:hypothetical protein
MLEVSIELVTQKSLAELNVDAAFTSLAITVGGNVHITAGKQIFTKPMIGGETLTIKSKTIHVEQVPETSDAETWTKLNERLNDLANQGFTVSFTTDAYILLSRKPAAIRREE